MHILIFLLIYILPKYLRNIKFFKIKNLCFHFIYFKTKNKKINLFIVF